MRTRGKRISVTTAAWIKDVFPALIADGHVGSDKHRQCTRVPGFENLESREAFWLDGSCDPARDLCEWGNLRAELLNKLTDILLLTFYLQAKPTGVAANPSLNMMIPCKSIYMGSKTNPLHLAFHMDRHALHGRGWQAINDCCADDNISQ